MSRRTLAVAAVALGLLVVVGAQRLAPIAGPPLYDGVIVEAPYQWLSPPAGHSGGARGVSQTIPVQGNQSPDLGVGTNENPPQAQVFAGAGFLVLPSGTSSIQVSIDPVPPPAQPSAGVIAGNVYRISVTNQSGQAITGQSSGGVTVELRGPLDSSNATIERFTGSAWVPLASDSVGEPNMYTAVVTDFGDFAMVAQPGWAPAPDGGGGAGGGAVGPVAPGGGGTAGPTGSSGSVAETGSPDPAIPVVGGIIIALVALAAVGLLIYTRRRPQPARHPISYAPTRPPDPTRRTAPSPHAPIGRKHRRR